MKGISIADLAYRIDVSPAYISLVERGLRSPTLENLVCIADVLGCTLNDLIKLENTDSTTD